MKKIIAVLILAITLSGCATYKFQRGTAPAQDKGYLVSYDGKPIADYTIGKDGSLPEMDLAKQRFRRRRAKVEYYYKKMGQIESRWKQYLLNPLQIGGGFLLGIIRWPAIAIADYKYNRDPKYKERIDHLDEQKDALDKQKIDNLEKKLADYIQEDLSKEEAGPKPAQEKTKKQAAAKKAIPAAAPAAPAAAAPAAPPAPAPAPPQPAAAAQPVSPVAVISATPLKGGSPLKVRFSGKKSYSKNGRIISYDWDFGDGDTSTLKSPVNTYWSTTYGSRVFTATLTVKDEKGMTASDSAVIEVMTK